MGIYASTADELEDVLCILQHPWRSFKAYDLTTRVWMGPFLLIYLPVGCFVAFLFELLFRLPFKLMFGTRK